MNPMPGVLGGVVTPVEYPSVGSFPTPGSYVPLPKPRVTISLIAISTLFGSRFLDLLFADCVFGNANLSSQLAAIFATLSENRH